MNKYRSFVLLVVFAVFLSSFSGCAAVREAKTAKQKIFAAQMTYNIALRTAYRYINDPDADPEIVKKIRDLVREGNAAIARYHLDQIGVDELVDTLRRVSKQLEHNAFRIAFKVKPGTESDKILEKSIEEDDDE